MRRLATPQDIDAVFSLYMHEKVVPYLGYDPMPLEDFRAIYQEMVESRRFFVYGPRATRAGCSMWPASARSRSTRHCTGKAWRWRW
jgi:putative acetyltransferase